MNRATWKRHAAVAAIFAAPILAAGTTASAQPKPPPAAAPAGDTQKATQHYLKGSDLFKAKKFAEALQQFKLSYSTVPSPNSHLFIARCLAAMGESRQAWLEFDQTSAEAAARAATEEKYGPTRDAANAERDELGLKLGLVTVDVAHAEPGTALHIGRYDVPRDRWGRPYPVEPGVYEVRIETPNRPVVKSGIEVAPNTRRAVMLDVAAGAGAPEGPAPATAGRRINPMRLAGFVTAGVGVVGLAMFAGAGAASKSTYSDLETTCGGTSGGCHGRDVTDEINKGKSQQSIANAGLGIGLVGVAVGTTLIVLSYRKKAEPARPSAELEIGPSWIGAKGTF